MFMQFIQSNSLTESTLMFNVLPGTEISVHAEFSYRRQNWYYGLQAMYSSMALKVVVRAHLDPTARKWGSQDPRTRTGSPPLLSWSSADCT